MIAQRPGLKLDPAVLKGQIELYQDFIETPNSEGKPFGVQTDQDWQAAIEAMESAGIIAGGRTPSDFYTNELVEP